MLALPSASLRTILCLGAHSDDIEIGCGATLLALLQQQPSLKVVWIVFSAEPPRDDEALRSARDFLGGNGHEVHVHSFRTSFFPYEGAAIKARFEELKAAVAPDLIFTHGRDDLHQDHRVLAELTWNTFRHHLVLEYEIPKYDGDLGRPNVFVPAPAALVERKVTHLMRHFQTQHNKHWFTADLFRGLMRLRGMECGAPFAEAFFGRKVTLGCGPVS
ncbi:MAG TPA: PIG-L deacetylase family protein [Opitutus sp.]|nr:PIG-L deacetylase family protein [Opitutus sp.]